jgi:hypothetical protein
VEYADPDYKMKMKQLPSTIPTFSPSIVIEECDDGINEEDDE